MKSTKFIALCSLMLAACGGGMTVEKLESAKKMVHPLQPKDEARSVLVKELGEPTGEDGDATWWTIGDPTCKTLKVTWMGPSTGTVNLENGC